MQTMTPLGTVAVPNTRCVPGLRWIAWLTPHEVLKACLAIIPILQSGTLRL